MQVPGDHRLTFSVIDPEGNIGSRSTILPVDPVPEEPVITVVSPAPGDRPRNTQPYGFEATVSDRQDAPGELLVTLTSSVDGFICGMAVDANGTATCAAILQSPGAHQLTFTVTDTEGYEGTAIVVTQVSDGSDIDDDGDGITEVGGDCDDTNGSIYPGATELPNGADDDCDTIVDEGTVLVDDDADGYCESQSIPCSDGSQLNDCNDSNFFVNPAAAEVCADGLDNNCNGQQDEIGAQGCTTYYFDGDGDGAGDLTNTVCACGPTGAHTSLNANDCDDTRATVGPSAPEVPDGVDNDCDGDIDEGTNLVDDDGDGFCEPQGVACSDGSIQGDCNDGDAAVNPDAIEVCADGIDNDCDNLQNESGAQGCRQFFADVDNDSFGDPNAGSCECAATSTYSVTNSTDCNDNAFLTNPNANEIADGVDNDCDGTIDEGTALFDDDGDGYCESPTGPCSDGSLIGDCDDSTSLIGPDALEICGNGIDDDCDNQQNEPGAQGCQTVYTDDDGDGFGDPDDSACLCSPSAPYIVLNGNDCDDNDGSVGPGGVEVPDGDDNDCDGIVDEGTILFDDDGDGFCESQGLACSDGAAQGDCDDGNLSVNPNAPEVCNNGIDDNCSGQQDEPNAVGCTPVYADRDNDGFGDPNDSQCACGFRGVYTVANGDDCDDTTFGNNPNAGEAPDGVDNNCNGLVDEGTIRYDDDGDGYCEGTGGLCTDGSLPGDCNDANNAVNPGAPEVCSNGIDDDCDGGESEQGSLGCTDYYVDSDRDGYGNPNATVCACNVPAQGTLDNTDCDDTQANVNPAANELPDGRDNDCDGQFDEGTNRVDADGDGYCANASTCTAQPGQSAPTPGDCNDGNAAINPGANEVCSNGVDDDCDNRQNEGINAVGCTTFYADSDGDGYAGTNSACYCSPTGTYQYLDSEDCYDANPAARPGQSQWFTNNRGDGSYDYNCDGASSRQYDRSYDCGCPQSTLDPEPFSSGWESGTASCGQSRNFVTRCSYSLSLNVPNPLWPIFGPRTVTECLLTGPDQVVSRQQSCR
jgi:hypothetical protein